MHRLPLSCTKSHTPVCVRCVACQADFANKYIGGGVIVGGCVQEEIRFAICPELTVSMLLCAYMKDDEAIILTGAERFSNYKVLSFRWVLCSSVLLMTGLCFTGLRVSA